MLNILIAIGGFFLMAYGAGTLIDEGLRAARKRFGDQNSGPAPGTRREFFAVDVPEDARTSEYQVVVEKVKPEPTGSGGTSRE